MTHAQTIRNFPKTGWRNRLARRLNALKVRPALSNFLDYQTYTALQLPFAGEWYVYWGGRTIAQNRHAVARDQRFAYDFLILRGGRSFQGPGDHNENYFCFDQPISAPANGVVAGAGDEVPDNLPGSMNPKNPLGNYVIVDHGSSEFSFFAHFKHGSVHVRSGDAVKAGDLLGRCGNSGNSSEPHLHYHLQNTAAPFAGDGLPLFFVDYVVDGKLVKRGEPLAGQTVRSQREFGHQ